MRQRMGMSWQPDSVDEVHEEDTGIVAPRAMKLVAKYHLEKAMRIVVVLSALKEVHRLRTSPRALMRTPRATTFCTSSAS